MRISNVVAEYQPEEGKFFGRATRERVFGAGIPSSIADCGIVFGRQLESGSWQLYSIGEGTIQKLVRINGEEISWRLEK